MSTATPDVRTHVMTVVEASWQDATGAWQTAAARMEDKSAGGACLRIKQNVEVGARLKIQWRFEQFTGVVKYCRAEGRDFVIGVQRDRNVPTEEAPAQTKKENLTPVLESKVPVANASASPQTEPPSPSANRTPAPRPRRERDIREWRRLSRQHAVPAVRRIKINANASETPQRVAGNERKPMKRKWLDLAPWHSKQEGPNREGDTESTIDQKTGPISQSTESRGLFNHHAIAEKDKPMMMNSTTHLEKNQANAAREVPTFQVELLPMEEIFRAAGVVSPRKGYSVQKVTEMINSEHVRNLAKDMKRAAVLMALDAAGVAVEQIQRDAKSRQEALDAYEASQKNQAEAEWARKTEEIAQIQSELESIQAHYSARISRCTEALARDKARFNTWVTTKEQESRSMTEAVELCLKAHPTEPASPPHAETFATPALAANAAAATKP